MAYQLAEMPTFPAQINSDGMLVPPSMSVIPTVRLQAISRKGSGARELGKTARIVLLFLLFSIMIGADTMID